ncbi:hypothetical protein [Streptomyces sp. NPDC021020]|uniref:hypothetical protein n=1 Tax=Streptomyces sp. NPDC021020 TaxID=3365109 RepID=UPI0037AA2011
MSSNYPPPQQPGGQNPYGPPPAGGQNPYGQPQPGQPQSPYAASPYAGGQPGAPAPGGFNAGAYAPPAPVGGTGRDNLGAGVAAGIAAALVAAVLYGLIIRGTKHEITYAAVAVGVLVGFALAKAGGRNPALPFIGIPLALLGVYAGQIFGIALLLATYPGAPGVMTILTDHYGIVNEAWKEAMGGMDFVFYAVAGIEGFVITKRVANG